MNLIVDQQIFEQYPNTLLGVVVLHNIDNKGNNPEIEQLLRDAEKKIIENLGSTLIIEHPNIAPWREAYRKFGAKPKDYPSSIENLLRRVSKGETVRHINKLVDIYNVISLRYLVPVGGEDLSKIKGDVTLTIAGGNETPVILLGEKEARPPYPKEVIYKDDIGTICRRWNWKEADRTKMTEDTKDTFMVIEGIPPIDRELIQRAVTDLAELVKKYCGGDISTTILNSENNQVKLME
ncbi:MAG: hypothetical protein ACD_19C00063G0001 [uncultured bacterium]|nr:MAG: hypothetical protein ACD_19C00063G0001 [uncultured bacterium]